LFCFNADQAARICSIIEWNDFVHRLGLQQFVALIGCFCFKWLPIVNFDFETNPLFFYGFSTAILMLVVLIIVLWSALIALYRFILKNYI
jgi:hypothetical protein